LIVTHTYTSALRFAAGGALLLVGGGLYEFARPASDAAALSLVAPSFIHVVAMVLLLAAVLSPTRRGAIGLCTSWVGINWLFELGQHRAWSADLAAWLASACGESFACERSSQYFLHGTFDAFDLAAAGIGGLVAWIALTTTFNTQEKRA
jgi:hypothetical protein